MPPQTSPPEFALTEATPSRVVGVSAVAVAVLAGPDGVALGPGAAELADDLGVDLWAAVTDLGLTGRPGEVTTLPVLTGPADPGHGVKTVLLVGVGTGTPVGCRQGGAALARTTAGQESVASSVHAVGGEDELAAFVEGVVLGSFRYTLRTQDPSPARVHRVVLALARPDADQPVLTRALATAGAGWLSRALASVPSNIKSPAWMAGEARRVAQEAGLAFREWDEDALVDGGFGGLVAVGSGSATPPRLVQLEYRPRKRARKAPHAVLVGKGITFDSGGLNIKPGDSMTTMKRDMTGAGVVLAVMGALAELQCPVRVTGLLCLAENAIGASSMRPGDVISQYGGRTTEIVNTDAEGRLVLADGLAYAVEHCRPDVLVDIATLTGAVKVALGLQTGGLYATSDALAEGFRRAGDQAGEPLWRLPLVPEYEELLASPIADAINAPEPAKSLTAALFLQHFVGEVPWVHLDLSSVGEAASDRFEWTAGPTGFGARLLLRWLCGPDPLEGLR